MVSDSDSQESKRLATTEDSKPDEAVIPPAFTCLSPAPGVFVIQHDLAGNGCMHVFFGLFLVFWTFGCVWVTYSYLNGGKMEGGGPIPLWFPTSFWVSWLLVAAWLIRLLFTKGTIRLDDTSMQIERRLFQFTRTRIIDRKDITKIVQSFDDDDSFPSWTLRVESTRRGFFLRRTLLIYRRSQEETEWLGQFLAKWAGVELSPL